MYNNVPTNLENAIDALPPIIRNVFDEIHTNTGAPFELILNTVIAAAAAAAAQPNYHVRQSENRKIPLSLITIAIADSGVGKTPVQKALFKGVERFEKYVREKAKSLNNTYTLAIRQWRVENIAIERQLQRAIGTDKGVMEARDKFVAHQKLKPCATQDFRILIGEASSSAAMKVAQIGSRALVLLEDEGNKVLNGAMGREFSVLLKGWDGFSIRIDRVNEGEIHIDSPRITVCIAIQGKSFERFTAQKGENACDQGLFGRSLLTRTFSTQGLRVIKTAGQLRGDAQDAFANFVFEMLIKAKEQGAFHDQNQEEALELSWEAEQRWREYAQLTEYNMGEGRPLAHFREFASKLADNVLRVAGILHVFSNPRTNEISAATLDNARRVMEFYLLEHQQIFGIESEQHKKIQRALLLENWFANQIIIPGTNVDWIFDKGAVLRNGPNQLRNKALLDDALMILQINSRLHLLKSKNKEQIFLNQTYFKQRLNGYFQSGNVASNYH